MTTPRNHFNKLAIIKELGSIEYRLADTSLSPALKRDIIARHVENLICDLSQHQAKFGAILERLAARYTTEDEIVAGCALLRSLVPVTWGCLPAGNYCQVPGKGIYRKTKEGAVDAATSAVFKHFAADQVVTVLNH